jgi:hypothetical protein
MVMKHYSPTGRRNHGRPLKRLLDTWDGNGSTSGPTAWQIFDDDSCAGDTGLKCCFMGRRHRFELLLPWQKAGFKCSSHAGDRGFKCLFWLRHFTTFLSLLRVRILTVDHETFPCSIQQWSSDNK